MVSVSLGARLQKVASFVPGQSKIADIGTDHAYLPIALYEQGIISYAVAIDVHQGPYKSACLAVASRHLEHVIDVRLGNGLAPLKEGEVNVLTLAGMGGVTMLDILFARPEIMDKVTEMVLQPQGAEARVRQALLDSGWLLREECLVEEEGRIYTVMAYSKNEGKTKDEVSNIVARWQKRMMEDTTAALVWYFGPLVLENPDDLTDRLLKDHSAKLAQSIEQMKLSTSSEVHLRLQNFLLEKELTERMRAWLLR